MKRRIPIVVVKSKTTSHAKRNVFLPPFFIFGVFYWIGHSIFWVVYKMFSMLVQSCYIVGLSILRIVRAGGRGVQNEIFSTVHYFFKRLAKLRHAQFRESIAVLLLLILLSWGSFLGARLIANALELKASVILNALNGSQHLADAQRAITGQNFSGAQMQFDLALHNFNQSQQELNSAGSILNGLLNMVPQKRDADKLLAAATLISKAGERMVGVPGRLKGFTLTAEGIHGNNASISQTLAGIQDAVREAGGQVHQAYGLMAGIDSPGFSGTQAQSWASAKEKIKVLNLTFTNLENALALASGVFGGGDKRVLVLFENNNELRASGGFPGTFGSFVLSEGKIKNLRVSSIYDLDGQLKESIIPPTPILAVNNRWFLRDSNWFVNFPDSAKKVSQFYEKEGGETPDIIISVTPTLVTDLLKLTGPIFMGSYNTELDADNFIEKTQVLTSVLNSSPINSPKQMLADFFPIFLLKLSTLQPGQIGSVLETVLSDMNAKHIMLYSRDPTLEANLAAYNWDGAVRFTDRDYLSVVTSNLNGTKTDLSISQKTNLETSISQDGSIIDKLTIIRHSPLPDKPDFKNSSFIRVLVPLGSVLITNEGFDVKNFAPPSYAGYKTDSDVVSWENKSVKDMSTGTVMGEESGKTFFANWLDMPGGSTKSITLVYKLPFSLQDIDHYSLLLQKQAGTINQSFSDTILFSGWQLEWKNFTEKNLLINSVSAEMPITSDIFLGTVLKKRSYAP